MHKIIIKKLKAELMTSTDTTRRFNISDVSYAVMETICLVPKKTTVWMQTGDVSNVTLLPFVPN